MSKMLLTPKDVADAVGVSESSMRRWIDSGRLKTTRTAGGHRRIAVSEAVRFIRDTGTPLVRGEILGLGDIPSISELKSTEEQQLFDALYAGDRSLARGLVTSWHMSGRTLADIFDGPMRSAARFRFGELWLKDPCGILIEHRATEMCSEIVHVLHSSLPAVLADPPVAMGAATESEEHGLLSQMASTVARECGFRDFNYGANVPIALLEQAAEYHKARVVWLTATMKPSRVAEC